MQLQKAMKPGLIILQFCFQPQEEQGYMWNPFLWDPTKIVTEYYSLVKAQ